jgi:hypothetical protein
MNDSLEEKDQVVESSNNNALEEDQAPERSNIELIYSYTEYRIKLTNDSLHALNTKLGSIIAFSGAAVGFSINLPNKAFIVQQSLEPYICYSCLILKILVCVLLVLAICTSMLGFLPQARGGMTPPNLLLKEHYYDSEEEYRLVITRTWIEALDEIEQARDSKAEFVKRAILALGGAAVLAASNIILASGLSIL